MFKAEIIADSVNNWGDRLTTMVVTFPRIVLAEFNTHRMFSRNSASSRAIPFEKMVKMVEENPFIPIKWMKDHKGMQGNEYFDGETCNQAFGHIDRAFGYSHIEHKQASEYLQEQWLMARDNAVQQAKTLNELGVTKQFVNRLLEPFMWHTVIVTASDWGNFFALRVHPDAEIHMQKIAEMMLDAYNNSIPKKLEEGEWHIPFGDKIDNNRLDKLLPEIQPASLTWYINSIQNLKVKIATARCARVSYLNFEGKDDYDADIKLHDRLLESGHMSPFEHCAKCMSKDEYYQNWSGNFKGFKQYRKMLQGENKTDERINKVTDAK